MLRTNNSDCGFYGTARQWRGEAFALEAWEVAFNHVRNLMGWSDEMTREFLDSKCGRHYSDTMGGKKDWRRALTRCWHLESSCREFFKAEQPQAYREWLKVHGYTEAERTLKSTGISKESMLQTVNSLVGKDYTAGHLEEWLRSAGGLAQALAIILNDIPEEIREAYLEDID